MRKLIAALLLATAACGTTPTPPPQGLRVSPHLLAAPQELPQVQRNAAGEMTGANATGSLLDLYDVAGQIRSAFVALQDQVRLMIAPSPPAAVTPN